MATTKKKISELSAATTLAGLWTIGVNALNESVKVSLEFLQTAYDNVVTATNSANTAAGTANTAASSANTATANANTATANANTATASANTAASNTNEAIAEAEATVARLEELEVSLVAAAKMKPTSMTLDYPSRITLGNKVRQKITALLYPEGYDDCVLFLGNDTALSVDPDGSFAPTAVGIERVHVIPTESTNLYQTIAIQVTAPTMRKVSSSSIRLTSNGIRLT